MVFVRPPPSRKADEINVLVTGFGPFNRHTENPSWLVAQGLPELIPRTKAGKKIRVYVRPGPVRVSYTEVRTQIPPLLFSAPEPGSDPRPVFDLVLHIGVSYARGYYEMETRAFRDGYNVPDVDGKTSAVGFASWKEEGAPEMIQTGFDPHAVLGGWKRNVKDVDLRRSADAGRFLCEYILFTSLLEYEKHSAVGKPPVTFLHVPAEKEPEDIKRGRKVAVGLIKALVDDRPDL